MDSFRVLEIKKSVFENNDREADRVRAQLKKEHTFLLNLMSSPGSGKTTMAVKIAKYLADKKRNVVLLLCDMTAPMLPCICPASELECERSLGSVLAAAHVTENLVKNNLITHKRLGYRWLELAASCAKVPIRYEADQIKQRQKEEQAQRGAGPVME